MGGCHSCDQDLTTVSKTAMELHVEAYGQDDAKDTLDNTTVSKIPLTCMTRRHAQKPNKLKLSAALNHGNVKKVNANSKMRPAHERKVALRQIFAGVSFSCTNSLVLGPINMTVVYL